MTEKPEHALDKTNNGEAQDATVAHDPIASSKDIVERHREEIKDQKNPNRPAKVTSKIFGRLELTTSDGSTLVQGMPPETKDNAGKITIDNHMPVIESLPSNEGDVGFFVKGQGGEALYKVESGGRERVYTTMFPPHYNPDKPTPVIIALQGSAGDGNLAELAKINKWVEAGYLVVLPGATGSGKGNSLQTWHGMYSHLMPNPEKIDDGRFVGKDLLDDLKHRGIKVEHKPFLYGFSNGGQLAQEINFRYKDDFAGIALVCAPKSLEQPETARPGASTGPVYIFYSDTDLPYGQLERGSGLYLTREAARDSLGSNLDSSYADTIEYQRRNGGFKQSEGIPKESLNGDLTVTRYTNALGQEMRIAHYHGDYAGHAVPGQPATFDMPGLGEGSKIPENSTMEILKMFDAELKRVKSR